MLRRRFLFLAVVGSMAAVFPARAADNAAAPTLIVRVRSIDSLLADLKYVTGLAGRADMAQKIDAAVKAVFPNGFEGIDPKRPLGLYGVLDPDGNILESTGVALVPVSDEKTFLGVLERLNMKPAKDDDGSYTVNTQDGKTAYFRFANRYAYVTALNRTAIEKDRLVAPAKVFSDSYPELLSVTFRIDQVPDSVRKLAISQIDARTATIDEEKPDKETKAQHEFKAQVVQEIAEQVKSVLKDGAALDFRLDVDRKSEALSAELSIQGKPNSGLEATFKALGSAPSLFAGLLKPDAALNFLVHGSLPAGLHKGLSAVLDEGIRDHLAKESDPEHRALAEKLFKAVSPSLKSGELDLAMSLRGPGEGDYYGGVVGLKVKEGSQIDAVIRDIVKGLPDPVKGLITLDAESAAGVKIHRVSLQQTFDEKHRKLLGDNPFYVAVRSDAVLVSGGAGGLEAIKQAAAVTPSIVPPLEYDLSVTHLVPLIGPEGKNDPAAAAKTAFAGRKDHDKIQVTLEGGKSLKVRVKGDAALVKFVSLLQKK